MGKEAFLFIKLARVLSAAAVVMSVAFPARADADPSYPPAVAVAAGSGSETTGKADVADCTDGLTRQQFCCHRVIPETQSTVTTQPRGEDEPDLAAGHVDSFPRPVDTRIAFFAKATPTFRVPRFLFGSFRS